MTEEKKDNWLYNDAILLKENGRNKGCLCLLLCLIDALAKKANPSEKSSKTRYISYLKDKLKSVCIDEKYYIEEKGKLLHLSEIIYKYFRCYFVHEGDDKESDDYEVQIEYDQPKGFKLGGQVLIDRRNKKLIFKSGFLIEVLLTVVEGDI